MVQLPRLLVLLFLQFVVMFCPIYKLNAGMPSIGHSVKVIRKGKVQYYVYSKYVVRVVDPDFAGQYIAIYRNNTNKDIGADEIQKITERKPVYDAHRIFNSLTGIWFNGMYNDLLFIDLGTGPERGFLIYNIKKGKEVFSFYYSGNGPALVDGKLVCDVQVPYKKEYENAPRARDYTEAELEYQGQCKKGYMARMSINLKNMKVTYDDIREEIIYSQ